MNRNREGIENMATGVIHNGWHRVGLDSPLAQGETIEPTDHTGDFPG
jgi:hypothetical protein